MTDDDLRHLELAEASLSRMTRILADSLTRIEEVAAAMRKPLQKEIRTVSAALRAAERTRRSRDKVSLSAKLLLLEDRLWVVNKEEETAKQIVIRVHREASAEALHRVSSLKQMAAMEQDAKEQQRVRERRYRKIPVIKV
jgi:hypothetical protein